MKTNFRYIINSVYIHNLPCDSTSQQIPTWTFTFLFDSLNFPFCKGKGAEINRRHLTLELNTCTKAIKHLLRNVIEALSDFCLLAKSSRLKLFSSHFPVSPFWENLKAIRKFIARDSKFIWKSLMTLHWSDKWVYFLSYGFMALEYNFHCSFRFPKQEECFFL